MEIFAIICSFLAAVAAVCAILTFIDKRKSKAHQQGDAQGTIESDIKYIRKTVDDMQRDLRRVSDKQNDGNIEVAKLDARVEGLENRFDKFEKEFEEWRRNNK